MGVLSVAGGILLAIAILIVVAIIIIAVATYPEYAKQEYRQKMRFDEDGDRKLNKVENARYIADKDGLDPEQAAYYVGHGCTYDSSDKSYRDCPKGTPDWGSPEAEAEVKAKQQAEEAKQQAAAGEERKKLGQQQAEQVFYDCTNKGLSLDYCQGLKDESIRCTNEGFSLDFCPLGEAIQKANKLNERNGNLTAQTQKAKQMSKCVINEFGYEDCDPAPVPSVQQPDTSSGSGRDATDSNLGKLFE